MHVVAIHNLKDDKQNMAGALAAVLKGTAFEALSRLRAPGSGPFVVGVFAEQEQAAALAGQLESGGFSAAVLSADELELEAGRWSIRRFGLNEHDLHVESADGRSRTLAYQDIDLILRGTGISSSTSIETTKQRKFDPGAAVLSGGLKMTKMTKTTREVTKEEREGFFPSMLQTCRRSCSVRTALSTMPLGPREGCPGLRISRSLPRNCAGAARPRDTTTGC